MGKDGKKYGGKDWLPGQSGNPAGRPPMPKEVIEAKKFNRVALEKLFLEWMDKPAETLQERFKDKTTPALEMMVISIIMSAIRKGDSMKLNFLLDRTVGKVKEQVELSGSIGVEHTLTINSARSLTDEQLKEQLKSHLTLDTIKE